MLGHTAVKLRLVVSGKLRALRLQCLALALLLSDFGSADVAKLSKFLAIFISHAFEALHLRLQPCLHLRLRLTLCVLGPGAVFLLELLQLSSQEIRS